MPAVARSSAVCSAPLDPDGHHALACAFGPSRVGRHEFLADVVYNFALDADLRPTREQRHDGSATLHRPYDVRCGAWGIDIVVVVPVRTGAGLSGSAIAREAG
ncbi:hypothetical protein FVE85_9795 [Porphyridium purpureum]|uniref:Uncharacterized protein n=1 Tax=Porphyridium purpureum TaxID=35688 RepID=A0A5J4YG22_PORPP|nr:hypothetical protein FVE85_9795 [Porphyridium purpureum]|eukprot:POR7854..scf273_44